jgi:uncharacterized repeat protein (TIGR03803 family)
MTGAMPKWSFGASKEIFGSCLVLSISFGAMIGHMKTPLAFLIATALQAQTFTTLHTFNGTDGSGPYPPIPSGNVLYGSTVVGGDYNEGTAYSFDIASGQLTTLHSFGSGLDGLQPRSQVALDSTGNLYGTTVDGGTSDQGVIYKIRLSDNTETVLYSFSTATGAWPESAPIVGTEGSLYGTTTAYGPTGGGTVYRLFPTGTYSILAPLPVTNGAAYGNLYLRNGYLWGTSGAQVFRVSTAGKYSPIATIGTPTFAGVVPVPGKAGYLYGTAICSGYKTKGFVYQLNVATRQVVHIHDFAGLDGTCPSGGLVADSAGAIYGTTYTGGPNYNPKTWGGYGVVYMIDANGTFSILYAFTGGSDGTGSAGITLDSQGTIYGASGGGNGALYRITRP